MSSGDDEYSSDSDHTEQARQHRLASRIWGELVASSRGRDRIAEQVAWESGLRSQWDAEQRRAESRRRFERDYFSVRRYPDRTNERGSAGSSSHVAGVPVPMRGSALQGRDDGENRHAASTGSRPRVVVRSSLLERRARRRNGVFPDRHLSPLRIPVWNPLEPQYMYRGVDAEEIVPGLTGVPRRDLSSVANRRRRRMFLGRRRAERRRWGSHRSRRSRANVVRYYVPDNSRYNWDNSH